MDIGIEIHIVSKDKNQKTVFLKEVIETKDVQSFRKWQKGERDSDVPGEMTLLLLYPKPWDKDPSKPRKIFMNEDYSKFMERMRSNGVIVK